MQYSFFNRDLSWLTFNERILQEAARSNLPVMDRISFLAIYSSNLDEFYRVRMPVLKALHKLNKRDNDNMAEANVHADDLLKANEQIMTQQEQYGKILTTEILPALAANGIELLYNKTLPAAIASQVTRYFQSQVMAFLQIQYLDKRSNFFPENNLLYFLIVLRDNKGKEQLVVLNIPSNELPRFFSVEHEGTQYIVFLDDVIRFNLGYIFNQPIEGCYSFKINRDAELDFKDEYTGDLAEALEEQLRKRDFGLATRFLYQPGLPMRTLYTLSDFLNLRESSLVSGGTYHNLKDFFTLPVHNKKLSEPKWKSVPFAALPETQSVIDSMATNDYLLHPPYHSYDTVLRFFNEAAIRPDVEEIYISVYRVASNSKIVNALISAAKNGKKVSVLVELKARFDEANNIKWAKRLKAAGARIIYSVTALKVHAKVALVKLKAGNRIYYRGLLGTGNFNENTAGIYTDHLLFTANHNLLRELELLFIFLAKRQKPSGAGMIAFKHLLVAQFNLQTDFIKLIDREIENARNGQPASISIKINNLEDEVLISKLYDASNAGVKVKMLVRSICRLVPGVPGMSENITVTRIVDRYLEHGRIFIFGNNNNPEVYLGSADWMNRNIYHRIEVCFPVYDEKLKQEVVDLMELQLHDNVQAVYIGTQLQNIPVTITTPKIRSQWEIYQMLQQKRSTI